MDLLSSSERSEIRAIFKGDVYDTFFKTPVKYFRSYGSLDIYQEELNKYMFEQYDLMALKEDDLTEGNEITSKPDGEWALRETVLSFNCDRLKDIGLIGVNNDILFTQEEDYVQIAGTTYKVYEAYFDGPIDALPILLKIKCRAVRTTPKGISNPIVFTELSLLTTTEGVPLLADNADYIRFSSLSLYTGAGSMEGVSDVSYSILSPVFANYTAALAWLNSTVKPATGIMDDFVIESGTIKYPNSEKFATGVLTLFVRQGNGQGSDQMG